MTGTIVLNSSNLKNTYKFPGGWISFVGTYGDGASGTIKFEVSHDGINWIPASEENEFSTDFSKNILWAGHVRVSSDSITGNITITHQVHK